MRVTLILLAAALLAPAIVLGQDCEHTMEIRFFPNMYEADIEVARRWFWNHGHGRGITRVCICVCTPVEAELNCDHMGADKVCLLVKGHYNRRRDHAPPHPMEVIGLSAGPLPNIACLFSIDSVPPWGAHGWGFVEGHPTTKLYVRTQGYALYGSYINLHAPVEGYGGMSKLPIDGDQMWNDVTRIRAHMGAVAFPETLCPPLNAGVAGDLTLMQGIARLKVATIEAIRFDRTAWKVAQSIHGRFRYFPTLDVDFNRNWQMTLGLEWLAITQDGFSPGHAIVGPIQQPGLLDRDVRQLLWPAHDITIDDAGQYRAGIAAARDWLWNNGAYRGDEPWRLCLRNSNENTRLCFMVNARYHPSRGQFRGTWVMGIDGGFSGDAQQRLYWFTRNEDPRPPGDLWGVRWDAEPRWNKELIQKTVLAVVVYVDGSYGSLSSTGTAWVAGGAMTPLPFSRIQLQADVSQLAQYFAAPDAPLTELQLQMLGRLLVAGVEAIRFDYIAYNVAGAITDPLPVPFNPMWRTFRRYLQSLGHEENVQVNGFQTAMGQPGYRWLGAIPAGNDVHGAVIYAPPAGVPAAAPPIPNDILVAGVRPYPL